MLDKHDVRRTRNGRTSQGSAPAGRKDTARDPGATASGKTPAVAPHGIKLQRYFTAPGDDGFANVEWELRTAAITGENGKIVFEQRDVEVPKTLDPDRDQRRRPEILPRHRRHARARALGAPADLARRRHASPPGARRTATSPTTNRRASSTPSSSTCSCQQKMAFNSPVWFNVGIEAEPQCSACFINSVDDTMESILTLAKTEGMLFKYGSGTGTNLSPIRSSKELLDGGGTASGPVSFMRGFDAFAGVIKSGGKTRRAAKMVILNIDHPDVDEFIWCKSKEEKKAWTLIDAGYDGSFDGEAYKSVFFQNSNNSVRVTDDFMEAVQKDRDWTPALVARRQPGADGEGARPVAGHRRRRRGSAAIPACSTTRRSTPGTRRRGRRASTRPTRAASTCTSTIRRATWRR